MTRLRAHLARLIYRTFVPLCPRGCRQPADQCACRWIPPTPEELP